MATLAIEKLIDNPNSQVLISLPDGAIKAFIKEDFSFGGTSNFNSPSENSAQQALSNTMNAATQALNLTVGTGIPQFKLASMIQTVLTWAGSERPVFELPLLFVAVRKDDDVRTNVRRLIKGIYPVGVSGNLGMKAPFGYKTVKDKKNIAVSEGTIIVSIGKWFRAVSQVLTAVNFTFSKETIESGIPLYAQGTISFQPFMLPTSSVMENYLRGAV